jgi:hypothetical protein
MMVGERQLSSHESKICNVIDERLRSLSGQNTPESNTNCSEATLEYPLFAWGGRMHHIPETFSIPSTSNFHEVWRVWFLGPFHESTVLKPFKKLTIDHRESLLELAAAQGLNPRQVTRNLSEIKVVMSWL